MSPAGFWTLQPPCAPPAQWNSISAGILWSGGIECIIGRQQLPGPQGCYASTKHFDALWFLCSSKIHRSLGSCTDARPVLGLEESSLKYCFDSFRCNGTQIRHRLQSWHLIGPESRGTVMDMPLVSLFFVAFQKLPHPPHLSFTRTERFNNSALCPFWAYLPRNEFANCMLVLSSYTERLTGSVILLQSGFIDSSVRHIGYRAVGYWVPMCSCSSSCPSYGQTCFQALPYSSGALLMLSKQLQ